MALVSPMVRTALFVSDIDRSAAFYKEVMELEDVYAEGGLTHATAAKLLGMPPETNIRYKILRAAGLNKGMVGLFQMKDPEPPNISKRPDGCSVGEACLVFYCADLDVVHDRLITGGHHVVCPPLHLEVEIEAGAIESDGRGQREMTFHDPDGVLVNLIEMDPTSDR
ncbi:MAG: VOC family protein [Rhodospirillaceae bacterium]|jgi:catechol 2,3-dioxygenase-like lactoylglutathione lyase family enzyme|nr:VOC family protein [Rhodospirillaceae bacterium]